MIKELIQKIKSFFVFDAKNEMEKLGKVNIDENALKCRKDEYKDAIDVSVRGLNDCMRILNEGVKRAEQRKGR